MIAHIEMTSRTKRQVVKRTAWTAVGIVLLFAWYVLSYGALWWYFGYTNSRRINGPVRKLAVVMNNNLYTPLNDYRKTKGPGARFLR